MKILAIRGCNLASLAGEFEVDFRKSPLDRSSIFAITGTTGSGKSTVLDAMCIALYESSPRLDSIKNSNAIESFGTTALQEDNVRTIMRRGTVEAYAETEFTAVDGNEYRIRWSIKRRNSSPTGNFAPAVYTLENLLTKEQRKLSSREHKCVIPELIGLTYDQFKRAVLLAQGNFAAFLKADETEKATILQTLTDTGIYSRISEIIYRRHTEAVRELLLIEEKKKDLLILTPEQLQEIDEQQRNTHALQEKNDALIKRLTAEKEWIARAALLERQLAAAMESLDKAKSDYEQLAPEAELLKNIDNVQGIRDAYTRRAATALQQEKIVNELAALKEAAALSEESFKAYDAKAKEAQARQEDALNEYNKAKPLINDAVKIETRISVVNKSVQDISAEIKQHKKELETLAGDIQKSKERSNAVNAENGKIAEWFLANASFEPIIPSIPLLVTNITSIESALTEARKKGNLLSVSESHLAENKKRLESLRAREEELARTLSSEIAALRRLLKENEPCPVCGSCSHEFTATEENTLAEKELEKAKAEVKREIEYLNESIQNYSNEISSHKSAIETYNASVQSLTESNNEIIQGNSEAAGIIAGKDAKKFFMNLAEEWKKNSTRQTAIKDELSLIEGSIAVSSAKSESVSAELSRKEKSFAGAENELKELKLKVSALLGKWESSEAAEKHFSNQVAQANTLFSTAVKKKGEIADKYNREKGEIAEKEKRIAEQAELLTALSAEITAYVKQREEWLDASSLDSLMAVGTEKTNALRTRIENAGKAVATAAATLEERKRNCQEHKDSPSKPDDSRSPETIEEDMASALRAQKEIAAELARINAVILKDQENNALFAQYKDEHEKRMDYAASWGKLNSMFGSANGAKLMRLAQGFTLDILLDVANSHLKEFSGRYMLSRISPNSLGIKVIDLEMMKDTRSVHSLSGGETFLASLALSLALSSISSNKMSIGSLFIDEGFGALDKETLNCAMNALEQLQNQGRRICIISHLSEMLDRIPVKIKVAKSGNGKSKIEITG